MATALENPAVVLLAIGLAFWPQASTQQPDRQRSAAASSLVDREQRDQPILVAGQRLTVVRHYKVLAGKTAPDAQALAALEIVDGADTVRYHETVPYAVEDGAFSEICSIDVHPLEGSMGRGLLLDTGCEPSAPMSGGPWRILGLENGQLAVVGKPIVAEGEFGAFIAGPVTRMGTITQMAADVVTVCVWTGYFFATVPVRIDWMHRTLALAQHCFYQTGHGPAEEGCEGPVQGLERRPTGPDLTFVRMFGESREPSVTPAHVVVKPDSAVTFLASKVRMTWEEDQHAIHLGVDDDLWLKVRVDGREGWIHTLEDFTALGLRASG